MVKISNNFRILKCLILLFIIFIEVMLSNNSDAPIKLKNLKCNPNDTWISVTSCKIKSHSRTKRTGEIQAILKKPVKYAIAHVHIYKRYSGWKPWVISNITVNVCQFFAGKYHPVLNIVKKLIMEKTSLNHTCPFLPGPVIVSDFDLKAMALGTLVIPSGDYRLDLIVKESAQVLMGSINIFAEVWEKY